MKILLADLAMTKTLWVGVALLVCRFGFAMCWAVLIPWGLCRGHAISILRYVHSFGGITKGYAITVGKVGRTSRSVRHCEAVLKVVVECLLPAEAIYGDFS